MARARRAAEQALRLDEHLAEAHAAIGFVRFRLDWDWPAAEAAFTRACELNPGHAPAHHSYALFLTALGRGDAAIAEIRRAAELDPLSLIISTAHGRVLHFNRQFEAAVAHFTRTIEMTRREASPMRPVFRTWLGGRDSFSRFHEIPMKAGLFRASLMASTICRLRILSSGFVYSRLFSDFPSTMTLAMTLDAKDSGTSPGRISGARLEECLSEVDQSRSGADAMIRSQSNARGPRPCLNYWTASRSTQRSVTESRAFGGFAIRSRSSSNC
jgi:tetratricopeptide (TPR) repeat protein